MLAQSGGKLQEFAAIDGRIEKWAMSEETETSAIRFGRTVLEVVVGELVDQRVQGIVYPANPRGVMGAGSAGALRSAAGPDVEREAMALAPLNLGSAIATSSGRLVDRGIDVVLHAVVIPTIGEHAIAQAVYRGLDSALKIAGDRKLLSLALPLLGISAEDSKSVRQAFGEGIVDVIVKRLRQRGMRLERVIFAVRFEDDRTMLDSVVRRARERVWTTTA